jgi:hypothetical protein
VELKEPGLTLAPEVVEASGTTIVHRLRLRLAAASDELARAEAIAAILRAVGGQDAIVVGRDASGALVTTTYSGKSGVLSETKAASGRGATDIVKPLRPIKAKVRFPDDNGDEPTLPPPPPVPWYKRRWVQVTIGTSVVAAVLTSAIVAATQPTGTSRSSGGVTFETSDVSQ